MSDITSLYRALAERVREGDGTASVTLRRSAFTNAGLEEPSRTLVDKVARDVHEVIDADIAAVRAAGLSEDQIFELIVCAAVGQATRQYEKAIAALDAATNGS